jgi:hypothetical protein
MDESFVTLEGSDSTEYSAKFLPPAIQNNLSGIPCKVRNLTSFFNPNPEHWANATMYDGNPEPKTYAQALKCNDFQNWWGAMCVELNNMEDNQVWEIIPKASIPKGMKIIGSRWVFACKDDGRYRARLVAKRFSQIPGKVFQENYAPVTADTTLHFLMVIKTLFKL